MTTAISTDAGYASGRFKFFQYVFELPMEPYRLILTILFLLYEDCVQFVPK